MTDASKHTTNAIVKELRKADLWRARVGLPPERLPKRYHRRKSLLPMHNGRIMRKLTAGWRLL